MSQKRTKSPVSLRGKNTMAENTRELTRVMLISSIILKITYVIGRYSPSFRSLHIHKPKSHRSACMYQHKHTEDTTHNMQAGCKGIGFEDDGHKFEIYTEESECDVPRGESISSVLQMTEGSLLEE